MACVLGMLLVLAVAMPSLAQVPEPADAPVLGWLDLATSRPLVFHNTHDLMYDPALRQTRVQSSQWQLERARVNLFKGQAGLEAQGWVAGEGQPVDLVTTLTLHAVDLADLMTFLKLPRAGEIQARVTGRLIAQIDKGRFIRIYVDLRGEPDSVRLSRALLKDMLAPSLGKALKPEEVDTVLDGFFDKQRMIPFENVRLTGNLGQEVLELKIPLKNEAVSIDFEPRVDAPLLWDLLHLLKDRFGLGQLKDAHVDKLLIGK